MIGPGTGVAPFRSYIQEKEELELTNKAWLFFGEQHFTTDFLIPNRMARLVERWRA
jgi:sulfite reductase (NADPH) flavoprotein alpha-component